MTLFKCRPRQMLEGEPVTYGDGCTITCSETGETLREGDEVLIHVERHNGSEAWKTIGVYDGHYSSGAARACDLHQKNEFDEVIATGRLAVASDRTTQEARLILRDVEVLNSRKIGE